MSKVTATYIFLIITINIEQPHHLPGLKLGTPLYYEFHSETQNTQTMVNLEKNLVWI